MLHKTLTLAGIIAVAGSVPLAPAAAQQRVDAEKPDTRPSITVMAPRARQTGRSSIGAPIMTLTAQSIVYFDDLNLGTEAGRDELHDRVEEAARSSCQWLDEVYPLSRSMTADSECVNSAIASAEAQVDAAIARGG